MTTTIKRNIMTTSSNISFVGAFIVSIFKHEFFFGRFL